MLILPSSNNNHEDETNQNTHTLASDNDAMFNVSLGKLLIGKDIGTPQRANSFIRDSHTPHWPGSRGRLWGRWGVRCDR